MIEYPSQLVDRLYREVLWRAPDPEGFARYTTLLRRGGLTSDGFREELQRSPEYQAIVRPLLAEIKTVYSRILLRAPTAKDFARHVNHFYQRFPNDEDRLRALQAGNIRPYLGIRPLNLEIDLTTQCNLRCIMCYFVLERFSKRKREDIAVEEFARIADQVMPYCQYVSLSSSTEPLLNKDFR